MVTAPARRPLVVAIGGLVWADLPNPWGPPAGGPSSVMRRGVTGDPHGRWINRALLDIGSKEVLQAAEAGLGTRTSACGAHTIQITQVSSQETHERL
jgi:hypothetical protein